MPTSDAYLETIMCVVHTLMYLETTFIDAQVFAITAPNVSYESTLWLPAEELRHMWPGWVACITEMISDLLIDLEKKSYSLSLMKLTYSVLDQ